VPHRAILRGVSEESMDTARRFHPAFNRAFKDGSDELFEILHPEAEWIPLTAVLDGIAYRGEEEVRAWIEEIRQQWDSYEIVSSEYRDVGDGRVLILGTWRARGRTSGVELDSQPAAWLIEAEDGRITRMQTFTDRAKAFEAAGLE
jgi:ketosteroid isomerase-like protein